MELFHETGVVCDAGSIEMQSTLLGNDGGIDGEPLCRKGVEDLNLFFVNGGRLDLDNIDFTRAFREEEAGGGQTISGSNFAGSFSTKIEIGWGMIENGTNDPGMARNDDVECVAEDRGGGIAGANPEGLSNPFASRIINGLSYSLFVEHIRGVSLNRKE
jgi:hypothetical protein